MCAFITLIAMKGLSGAMGFFSKVVPPMVVLTVGIGIAALIRFGFPASLFGFGNLISVLYPLMGYYSYAFIICLTCHYCRIRLGSRL